MFSFKRIKINYNHCPISFTNKVLVILSFFLMIYLLINFFIYRYTSISILPSTFQVSIISIINLMGFLIIPLFYSTKYNSSKYQNEYKIKTPTNTFIKAGLTLNIITFSLSILIAIINNNS